MSRQIVSRISVRNSPNILLDSDLSHVRPTDRTQTHYKCQILVNSIPKQIFKTNSVVQKCLFPGRTRIHLKYASVKTDQDVGFLFLSFGWAVHVNECPDCKTTNELICDRYVGSLICASAEECTRWRWNVLSWCHFTQVIEICVKVKGSDKDQPTSTPRTISSHVTHHFFQTFCWREQ